MKVFIDTEFSDFSRLELISMGMVTDDGRHCYVELSEGWTPGTCSAFVRKDVLPLLDLGASALPIRQAANVVSIWLQGLTEPLEICTDSNYDIRLFAKLLAEAAVRPGNLQSSTVIVLPDAGVIAQEGAYAAGLRRHHALDDAKALLAGWNVCGQS